MTALPRSLPPRFLVVLLLALGPASLAASALDTAATLTTAERLALVELLHRSQAETLRLVADIGEERWFQRPAEDRWSIGEIVEHLVLAEEAIRNRVGALVAGDETENRQVRTFPDLGQVIAFGSDRKRRFEAPEPIRPQKSLGRTEALLALVEARTGSLGYVLGTEDRLHSRSARGPIGEELDGPGWLALLGAHNLRHNRQIVEVRDALGLPPIAPAEATE